MELHNLIKIKREKLGLTQDDIASKLNVTRQAVQNWENGKRAISNDLLAKYFEILDFNAEEILTIFGFLTDDNLEIQAIDYSTEGIKDFQSQASNSMLTKFPTLYLGVGKKKNEHNNKTKQLAYVGEANSIVRRTNEHLNAPNDKLNAIKIDSDNQKETLYIIGHSKFNKSATLELEQMFMDSLLGDEKFSKIYNGRNNGLSADFYERNAYRQGVFPEIWKRLYKKDVVSSLEEVHNSALFANSPFKSLSNKQLKAKEIIDEKIETTLANTQENAVIKIEGLAGSGKTVLMSKLFYDLWKKSTEDVANHKSVSLLVRHEQQLRVYKQIAKKLNMDKDTVMAVPTFINKGQKVDVLLVDEAHLLWSGNYSRVNKKKWEPELQALHKLAKVLVLIYDPNQLTSARSKIFDNPQLENIINGKDTITVSLDEQWRINASEQTVAWIEDFAHGNANSLVNLPEDDKYDIQFFDNAANFKQAIEIKNLKYGLSRIVATYDWKYAQKGKPNNGERYFNVTFGNVVMPWNLELPEVQKNQQEGIPWQEISDSIGEVGSDFTVQGIDLNYVGVVLGPSVVWNKTTNSLDIDANKSKDKQKMRKIDGTYNTKENKKYLKNVVNVLLTRGVHGLYVYAVNDELREKLISLTK